MSLKKKLALYAAILTGIVMTPALALAQAADAPANKFDSNAMIGLAAAIATSAIPTAHVRGTGRGFPAAGTLGSRQP